MPPVSRSDEEDLKNSKVIRKELVRLSDEALERHPILRRNDLIGGTLMAISVAAIVGAAVAYYYGAMPAWAVILSSAFFMAFMHDLEHDLLHRLYFRDRPWLYNTAMVLVWATRPSTISPWVRRDWHAHHHRASGTPSDIEERGLLLGETWGVRRAIMSLEPFLAIILRPLTIIDMLVKYTDATIKPGQSRARVIFRNLTAHGPIGPMHATAFWWFIGLHVTAWYHQMTGTPWTPGPVNTAVQPYLDFIAITLLVPNAFRTFCLYIVSSNSHYYGDFDPKITMRQTQVMNSPWLWPLQLFCCNFGSTHIIHHFAVQYPFYMRLVIAKDAHRVMRAHGVRFNDFSNMTRANRWHAPGATVQRNETREANAA